MPRKPKPLEELSPAYRRRIERGLARGFSRSQARGHARVSKGELPISAVEDLRRRKVVERKPRLFARYTRRSGRRTDWYEQEFDGDDLDGVYRYITRNLTKHDILTIIYGHVKYGSAEKIDSPIVVREQWESKKRETFVCAEEATYSSLHQMTDREGFKYFFPTLKAFEEAIDYGWCDVETIYVRFRQK
jgi:hypothetical protein